MEEMFATLADPTRLRIVEMLAQREHSVNELVAAFDVSQPAISRHLRVLREAKLVRVRIEGQRHMYRLEARRLAEIDAWLAPYRRLWAGRLDALEQLLEDDEEG